jgi:beta-glucosidase
MPITMTTPTDDVDMNTFPPDFLWGAATAAYQIEGATTEDGRGESVWDRFAATAGKVRNGETGAVACDFYHRFPTDIALMQELGIDAFRFSIAWPRIVPEGRGRVNNAGLDFYDRLVDKLLEVGIAPFVTLFHWDLPQILEDEGGWTARSTIDAFVDYAEAVAARLGDRVPYWTTHNEPGVVSSHGYGSGVHAPGRANVGDELAAAHHLLVSHGLAVQALRRTATNDPKIGIALNMCPTYPANPTHHDDLTAAKLVDAIDNRWFLDPIYRGSYPAEALAVYEEDVPIVGDDLSLIAAPIDFLGVNMYFRKVVSADSENGPQTVRDPAWAVTDMGWEIYPDGLHDLLLRLQRDYDPMSIYVTENGAAFSDTRSHDGGVHDPERISYLEGHTSAVRRARTEGAHVDGYFAWSLLDNFEWAYGYAKRFGLIYVDFHTLERVPKDSFRWYQGLVGTSRQPASLAVEAG